MLHIILGILKILGIILISILGVLLLLMLLVLLIPVRYRMDARIGEERWARAKVSWFLHMFGIRILYENGKLKVILKLFWIIPLQLIPARERKGLFWRRAGRAGAGGRSKNGSGTADGGSRKGEPSEAESHRETMWDAVLELEGGEAPEEAKSGHVPEEREGSDTPEESKGEAALEEPKSGAGPEEPEGGAAGNPHELPDGTGTMAGPEASERDEGDGTKEEKPSLLRKILNVLGGLVKLPGRLLAKLRRSLEKLKYTIRTIYGRICGMRGRLDAFLDILRREETVNAFALCRKQLFRLVRHVAPRKVKGELRFGLNDPAQTGQLYGLYCAACPIHKYKIRMNPDFEQQVLEGHVMLKGRVCAAKVLVLGLQIFFDRNIRYLIKQLRQA